MIDACSARFPPSSAILWRFTLVLLIFLAVYVIFWGFFVGIFIKRREAQAESDANRLKMQRMSADELREMVRSRMPAHKY